jgi:hypothetical protein
LLWRRLQLVRSSSRLRLQLHETKRLLLSHRLLLP